MVGLIMTSAGRGLRACERRCPPEVTNAAATGAQTGSLPAAWDPATALFRTLSMKAVNSESLRSKSLDLLQQLPNQLNLPIVDIFLDCANNQIVSQ